MASQMYAQISPTDYESSITILIESFKAQIRDVMPSVCLEKQNKWEVAVSGYERK